MVKQNKERDIEELRRAERMITKGLVISNVGAAWSLESRMRRPSWQLTRTGNKTDALHRLPRLLPFICPAPERAQHSG